MHSCQIVILHSTEIILSKKLHIVWTVVLYITSGSSNKYNSHSTSLDVPCCYSWFYEIEKYVIGVVFNSIIPVLNFMKIGQLIQKLSKNILKRHRFYFVIHTYWRERVFMFDCVRVKLLGLKLLTNEEIIVVTFPVSTFVRSCGFLAIGL